MNSHESPIAMILVAKISKKKVGLLKNDNALVLTAVIGSGGALRDKQGVFANRGLLFSGAAWLDKW